MEPTYQQMKEENLKLKKLLSEEKKHSKTILQQQNVLVENIFESITNPFYIIDTTSYEVIMANSVAKFHLDTENKTCYALTHNSNKPCDGINHLCPLHKVLKTKKPTVVEHIHTNKEGKERIIEIHGYPIFDDKGNVIQMIEYNLDITNRKKAEQALFYEQAFSKKIIDASCAIIIGLDSNHLIKIFNKGAEKITGYKKSEVIGKDWFEIFFPSKMLDEMNNVWKKAWGVLSHSYENPIVIKSGEKRLISWQTTGISDGEDIQKHMIISIGEDITEHKKAEQNVIKNEKKLNAVFNGNPNPTHLVNTNFEIVLTNSKLLELKNLKQEEILGKKCYEIYQQNQFLCKNCGVKRVFENKTSIKSKNQLELSDGSIKYFETYGYPVFDDNNNIIYAVETTIDITSRKKTEQALVQSEKKFRGLFKGMSAGVIFCSAIYDNNGNMTDCIYKDMNPVYEKIIKIKKEIAIGRKVSEILPDTEPEWFSIFGEVVKTGNSINFEMYHKQSKKYYSVFSFKSDKNEFTAIFDDISDNKKVKKVILESKNRLKALSNATYEAIFFSDNGFCIETNEVACQMFGYSYNEIIGMFGVDFIAPESKEIVKNNLLAGYLKPYDAIAIRKNGSKFYAEFHGRIFSYKGKEIRITAVRDITKRKKDEELLQKRLHYIKFTNKISTSFINIKNDNIEYTIQMLLKTTATFTDVERAYVFLFSSDNKKLELLSEWCKKDTIPHRKTLSGVSISDFVNKTDYFDGIEKLKNNKIIKFHITDIKNIPELKSKYDILNNLSIKSFVALAMFSGNNLIGYVGFEATKKQKKWTKEIIDSFILCKHIISNTILRIRTEKALKNSELTYRTLFENNPLALWEGDLSDINNKIIELKEAEIILTKQFLDENPFYVKIYLNSIKIKNVNKATLDLFKFSNQEDFNKNRGKLLNKKTVEFFKKCFVIFFNGERLFRDETEYLDANGNIISVIVQIQINTNFTSMVVSHTDISEQKETQKQLKKYADTQKVLMQEVNHRVKNNLSAIISMMHKEQDKAEAQGLPTYSAIEELTQRVSGLATVHSLLSQSEWQPLLLNKLCKQVVDGRLNSLPLKANLDLTINESEIYVNSSQAHHLTLVINELTTNTIKYALLSRQIVKINILIKQNKKVIHFSFSDDGPGYPQEMLDGNYNQTGIGFNIIKGIVRQSLAGKVEIKNKNGAITIITFKNEINE